jgi:hypothetical protein
MANWLRSEATDKALSSPTARVSGAGLHASCAFAAAMWSLISWVRILFAGALLIFYSAFVIFIGLLRAVDVGVVRSKRVVLHDRKILPRSA